MSEYRNPIPTVDAVLFMGDYCHANGSIVLIKRKNPPHGYAMPGGFVNEGESYEAAVVREVKEETGLDVEIWRQFYTYSKPSRDPRRHIATTVYLVVVKDVGAVPVAADDAAEILVKPLDKVLASDLELAFDHRDILNDVYEYLDIGAEPTRY